MAEEGWLERDGVRLHYVDWTPDEELRGPALFALHGLSANALYWSRLAAALPGRRLVALDQRSHGASDRPPAGRGAYASRELTQDAAHAIEQLGLDRPVVLGHSWGAGIALELATARPDVVSGLGFIDGPAAPMSERLSWDDAARMLQPPLPRFRERSDAAGQVRPWITDAWADDLQAYAEASAMEDEGGWVLTLTAPVRLEILREMYDAQPQLHWAELAMPSLLALAGGDREIMPWKRQGAELVQSLVPDLVLRWYESAHDIPLIRPRELAADVDNLCLRSAWRGLAGDVAALDGDWQRADGGWTARELLAHLASTVTSLPHILAPAPAAAAGVPAEPFDADRWNAGQVRRRQDRSPDELREELVTSTESLEAALAGADLAATASSGPYAGMPLGDAMERMLDHQRGHLAELRGLLG